MPDFFRQACVNPRYEVWGIPVLKDNYIWLYLHKQTAHCIVVDPGEAERCSAVIREGGLKPLAIFVTHHHADHCAGVGQLLETFKRAQGSSVSDTLPVYGPQQALSAPVNPDDIRPQSEGDKVALPDFPVFRVLAVPGHTHSHVAFYGGEALFCGDTLFTGGCGRLFEGTPGQLLSSLQKISALAADTLIYCGHEYTEKNLGFALGIEPHNPDLQTRYRRVCQQRAKGQPTVPSTLALELKTNPFLRTDSPEILDRVAARLGKPELDPVAVFAALRAWKDVF